MPKKIEHKNSNSKTKKHQAQTSSLIKNHIINNDKWNKTSCEQT